ncbi:MAG: DUF2752 domain-containing protein [Melioribacteraceae bacterium]|nr:DUF2752 domain-containing protein [Melioribacteraceae bacterium]
MNTRTSNLSEMDKIKKIFKAIEWEGVFWLVGFIYLFSINPYQEQHLTLCLYKLMGIDFCPGCGLGRSISFCSRLDFVSSFKTHPLGIAALIIISFRIGKLFLKTKMQLKQI